MEVFREASYHFLQIFVKKSLASVLFSRDGRVMTNILLFSALLKCAKGELYFPLKNNYLYNLWYLAVLKTLNTHGGFMLTLTFPDNIIFPEKLLLKLYSISLPTIKEMVYFKSKLTLSKTIGYLLTPLVTHKEEDFLQATTSKNVLTHKFTLNQLLQRRAGVII